jgi:hypothetical protein
MVSDTQWFDWQTLGMNEEPGPIDHAVEVATKRTRTAQDEFAETPPVDEEAPGKAAKVRRRAEDLSVLAEDAVEREVGGEGQP